MSALSAGEAFSGMADESAENLWLRKFYYPPKDESVNGRIVGIVEVF